MHPLSKPGLIVWLAALAMAAGACGEDVEPLRFNLLRVPTVAAGDLCPHSDPARSTEPLPASLYTLRLTFARRDRRLRFGQRRLRDYELVCDVVLKPGQSTDKRGEFLVPLSNSARTTVIVEAFDPKSNNLVLAGRRELVGIDAAQSAPLDVYLHRADAQSCPYQARRVRAFHTATLLPNGQVLLIGGLVGTGKPQTLGPSDKLFEANASADVFDPSTLSWPFAVDDAKLGRAFHRAVLLPSPAEGPYRILLLGGLVASGKDKTIARRRTADALGEPFLISPVLSARPGETAIVTYAPASADGERPALLRYKTLGSIPAFLFPEVALSADGRTLLVVGGATAYTPDNAATSKLQGFSATPRPEAVWVALRDTADRPLDSPKIVKRVKLGRIRVGHRVARFAKGRFVALGGNMDGTAAELSSAVAETAGLRTDFSAQGITGVDATAWHTLAPLGLTDAEVSQAKAPTHVVWAGGFKLTAGTPATAPYRFAVAEPSKTALRLLRASGLSGELTQVDSKTPSGFSAAGYQSAVRLADGTQLISGGNLRLTRCELPPKACTRDSDCPDGKCSAKKRCATKTPIQTDFCPLDQQTIVGVDSSGSKLAQRASTPKLKIRRYGHQMTRLLDGTVMVTGGVSLDPEGNLLIPIDGEMYSPRRGTPAEDHPFARKAASVKAPQTRCRTRQEVAQGESSITIVTSPSPRTISGLRSLDRRLATEPRWIRLAEPGSP